MLARIRSKLTFANVASSLALFVALSTGGAYAANTIGSSDIIDESIQSVDIKNGQVAKADIVGDAIDSSRIKADSILSSDLQDGHVLSVDIGTDTLTASDVGPNAVTSSELGANAVETAKLADGAVTSAKVLDDTQAGGGLDSADINPLNGDQDIQDNTVTTFDIATNAIDSDEVLDFGLSNADVAVLGADVNADATIAQDNGLGGTTGTVLGTGQYEIDFGRDISQCTTTATIGPATAGAAQGLVDVADRSGNAEAVFVRTYTHAGVLTSLPFRLVVVC